MPSRSPYSASFSQPGFVTLGGATLVMPTFCEILHARVRPDAG